jgi:hypothetical protein
MASRHARAKPASNPKSKRTTRDAVDGVRAAVVATNGQAEADDLTDEDALGLYFSYVYPRQPTDIAAYLTKIFGDAPYIETFLSNSEPRCMGCCGTGDSCTCKAA